MAKRSTKATKATAPATPAAPARVMRARYDAAAVTDDNRRQWQNVDSLSAASALTAAVREKLRNRSRYEVANNSYAKGIGLTIANDTVGTGPQLQMLTADKPTNTLVESEFWRWMQVTKIAEKLRLMRFARYDSGEVFGIYTTNGALPTPVKLDLRLRESEECADPTYSGYHSSLEYDGIKFDDNGNPSSYRFLKQHPGSISLAGFPTDHYDVPARFVFHYFHPDRPGQIRGIPDITPAVSLFNELRRYSSAVIAAAETAADFAAVVKSQSSPSGDDVTEIEPFDTVELVKRMGVTLPAGWEIQQLKAEQPTTTYGMFFDAKLKEIARCLSVPFTVASLDSSVSNMSSAYVDRQVYTHNRLIDRSHLEVLLETLFGLWLDEARRIADYLPEMEDAPAHQFFWPSLGHHADPLKVANAAKIALGAGLTSIPKEHAKNGDDWEQQQESAAKAMGLSVPEYRKRLVDSIFGPSAPVPVEDPASPAVPPKGDPADDDA